MAWFFFKGRYGFGGSKASGVWWIRFNDYLVHLKSPRYESLFSERYGYYGFRWSWGGWRFIGKQSRSLPAARNADEPA